MVSTRSLARGMSLIAVIRVAKMACIAGLLFTVAIGTAYFDRRFTMLLVPPFLVYWGTTHGDSLLELPIFRLLKAPLQSNSWNSRIFLAAAGVTCAYVIELLLR